MIKINDDNIFIGEIKQVLKEFNLPRAKVYKENDRIVNGLHYIKSHNLYIGKNNQLKLVGPYTYNHKYLNLTTNLNIENNVYDSYTHKYMGNYLRFLRDYASLNLMSMYNCTTYETLNQCNIEFSLSDDKEIVFSSNDSSLIYLVPVRAGNSYTIGINSSTPIEVLACIYDNNTIVSVNDNLYRDTYAVIRSCSLTHPYIYTKLSSNALSESVLKLEQCLYLLIKVSAGNESSVVVLEGDYSRNTQINFNTNKLQNNLIKYKKTVKTDDEYRVDEKVSWEGDFSCVSRPQLLSYENSKGKNLLADRFVEYLTENPITCMSEDYDIKKLQKYLIRNRYVESDYLGIWSEEDKQGIYKIISDNSLNSDKYDVIGYVDKDVENIIGGLD